MTTRLYGIPNCDTVKKARVWLAQNNIDYIFHDFKREDVPSSLLDAAIAQVGWASLLNRKGATWRKLDAATQAATVDASSAKDIMQAHPSAIKRPVVAWSDGRITVGFKGTF